MASTLNNMIAAIPADQQREVDAQASRLIEDEMTLRDLRKAHALTQERMAEALHISQDGVSRIEKRSDFLLSTLLSYVEAMGGRLRLVAEFLNRNPVTLANLDSLTKSAKTASRRRQSSDERAPP